MGLAGPHRHTLHAGDTAAVFKTCQIAHVWNCHILQDGALYLCAPAAPPASIAPDERCALEPVADLRDRLERFLNRTEPLAACRTCLGSVGNLIPHSQANAKTWHQKSQRGAIDREQLGDPAGELSRGPGLPRPERARARGWLSAQRMAQSHIGRRKAAT